MHVQPEQGRAHTRPQRRSVHGHIGGNLDVSDPLAPNETLLHRKAILSPETISLPLSPTLNFIVLSNFHALPSLFRLDQVFWARWCISSLPHLGMGYFFRNYPDLLEPLHASVDSKLVSIHADFPWQRAVR